MCVHWLRNPLGLVEVWRSPGDADLLVADTNLLKKVLGWVPAFRLRRLRPESLIKVYWMTFDTKDKKSPLWKRMLVPVVGMMVAAAFVYAGSLCLCPGKIS